MTILVLKNVIDQTKVFLFHKCLFHIYEVIMSVKINCLCNRKGKRKRLCTN